MTTPIRIQRSRAKGARLVSPNGLLIVCVSRPSPFGNPFPWKGSWIVWAAVAAGFRADKQGRIAASVAYYREWLVGDAARGPLADEKAGDAIEYESGVSMDTADAAREMAGGFAKICGERVRLPPPPSLETIRKELRGKNLACWCPIAGPCHADVLLEIANGAVAP